MAPRRVPTPLASQCLARLVSIIQRLVHKETNLYYKHDEKTNQVVEFVSEEARRAVRKSVCNVLPADLVTDLISELISVDNLSSPHLVLDILVTNRLRRLTFELTKENRRRTVWDREHIVRVNQDDISKCLNTLDGVFREYGGGTNLLGLEQFFIVDRSQDPDFQGDPINNMLNTNLNVSSRVGDWAGIMLRLCSVSRQLADLAPRLTHVVLPFVSDQILANISAAANLVLFQNVYRSTVTEVGIFSLADGSCRASITHIVLCLNTHANVPNSAVSKLLTAAPQLRVLEFGGSCNTKSLYFQGGDAKRRQEVFNVITELGSRDPTYTNNLVRMLIFREGNKCMDFHSILNHSPSLSDLTMFGWESITVDLGSWISLSRNLVRLELVGIGFNSDVVSVREELFKFDCDLFAEARQLEVLKLAGWGDTSLAVDKLLGHLVELRELYLEDVKVSLHMENKPKQKFIHHLSSLSIFHCSTTDINLIQNLCSTFPMLTDIMISSLYLDDPSRGLPFHFHLPQLDRPNLPRHPVADLKEIGRLQHLQSLYLNVSYQQDLDTESSLLSLLVKMFPRLTRLYLDNFISRRNGALSYTLDRVRTTHRLQSLLKHRNRDISVDLN